MPSTSYVSDLDNHSIVSDRENGSQIMCCCCVCAAVEVDQ